MAKAAKSWDLEIWTFDRAHVVRYVERRRLHNRSLSDLLLVAHVANCTICMSDILHPFMNMDGER